MFSLPSSFPQSEYVIRWMVMVMVVVVDIVVVVVHGLCFISVYPTGTSTKKTGRRIVVYGLIDCPDGLIDCLSLVLINIMILFLTCFHIILKYLLLCQFFMVIMMTARWSGGHRTLLFSNCYSKSYLDTPLIQICIDANGWTRCCQGYGVLWPQLFVIIGTICCRYRQHSTPCWSYIHPFSSTHPMSPLTTALCDNWNNMLQVPLIHLISTHPINTPYE